MSCISLYRSLTQPARMTILRRFLPFPRNALRRERSTLFRQSRLCPRSQLFRRYIRHTASTSSELEWDVWRGESRFRALEGS